MSALMALVHEFRQRTPPTTPGAPVHGTAIEVQERGALRCWVVHTWDNKVLELTCCRPATQEELLALHPGALSVEPDHTAPPAPEHTAPVDLYGFTTEELEGAAGDDWLVIRDDPQAIAQFGLALRESRQIEAGTRPERWSAKAVCSRCGPVYVPPYLAGQRLRGCRWCAPRRAGVSIPQPTEESAA